MSSNKLAKAFPVFAVLVCLAVCSFASDDILSLNWRHGADGDIRGIAVGDVDNDTVPEVVAVSSNTVYVLDYSGRLKNKYSAGFPISSVYVGDIDGDGFKEILLGSGFMHTFDTNITRFDFSDKDNIQRRMEYAYKVTRDQGDVYMIRRNSKIPAKLLDVGEWVRDIYVDDLDMDGVNEILVAAGGTNIDYMEKVHMETDPDTGNQTYITNLTEINRENGSVSIFLPNGTLEKTHRMQAAVWRVRPVSFNKDAFKSVAAGAGKIEILDNHLVPVANYKYPQNNYTVEELSAADINNNRVDELAVAFTTSAVGGVYVLTGDGTLLWEYRIPSGDIKGASFASLDMNGEIYLVVASGKSLYILDRGGRLKWTQAMTVGVDLMKTFSTGKSTYDDFVISSGNSIYLYNIGSRFIRLQTAEKYYDNAKKNYESANYQAAMANLTNAKYVYAELSNQEGLEKCEELLGKIDKNLKVIKKESADSLYKEARNEYYLDRMAEAKEYLQKAREIYVQIGDIEGATKCDNFFKDMENQTSTEVTAETTQGPQTTSEATTTTIKKQAKKEEMSPVVLGLFALIIVFLLLLGLKQIISWKKPSKNDIEDDAPETGISDSEVIKQFGEERKE